MRISIVVPSFNQGKFIRRTIDSILNQGYPDLELIVMDGGSTDETLSVLKSYGDQIIWQSAPDSGQTQAVNNGWKRATGQILGWVNSDDTLLPGALASVARCFQNQPDTRWLYGNCHYIDANDRILGDYPTHSFNLEALVRNVHNYIPQPAVFLRRDVLDQAGYLNEDLHYVMDLEYWLRLGLKSPAAYLDQEFACLRLHQDAKSVASFDKFSRELTSVIEIFFTRPDLPENLHRLKNISLTKAYLLAADMNLWAGDLATARQFALKSWLRQPFRPHKLFVYLLLGEAGLSLARRRHPNPYEMGTQG